jgi:putative transposase
VLESYVTKSRDKAAALTFMRKAMKCHGRVDTITTDGVRSHKAALKDMDCAQKQEVGCWANNRVKSTAITSDLSSRSLLNFHGSYRLRD